MDLKFQITLSINDNKTINNMDDVVSGFNKFFVNMVLKLAIKISDTDKTKERTEYEYGHRNRS